MHGQQFFKHVEGGYREVGYLLTTNLALSDGDANLGTIKTGKGVDRVTANDTYMRYASASSFLGFLSQDVSLNGLQDLSLYMPFTKGWLYQPIRRGQACTILVPDVRSLWEVEGLGTVGINTLVVTSGTGALAIGTTIGTELTQESGAWRKAVGGETVFGLFRRGLTPVTGGNVRSLIEIVSPYIMAIPDVDA